MKTDMNTIIKELIKPYYIKTKDIFDLTGKSLLKKNKYLKDFYYGKRCFHISTGASLNSIDITKLSNEHTLGIAQLWWHKKFKDINLKIFLRTRPMKHSVDKGVLSGRYLKGVFPEYKDKVYQSRYHKYCNPNVDRALLYIHDLDEILPKESIIVLNPKSYKFVEKNKVFNDKELYYFKRIDTFYNFSTNNPGKINIDLTKRITGGGGHFDNSILVLIYMGFKEIYLCGAGYTYYPANQLHFYDNYVFPIEFGYKKASSLAKSVVDLHNKRFESNIEFFGLFKKDDFYHGIYVIKYPDLFYNKNKILNEYAKSQGVKIYNIVPSGFDSPAFEKINWKEVVTHVL